MLSLCVLGLSLPDLFTVGGHLIKIYVSLVFRRIILVMCGKFLFFPELSVAIIRGRKFDLLLQLRILILSVLRRIRKDVVILIVTQIRISLLLLLFIGL